MHIISETFHIINKNMPDIYVTKKCLFAQDLAQIGENSTNWFTKFTAFCTFGKGQMKLQKWRHFWKSSKGREGGGHYQSKKLCCIFWTIKQCFKQVLFGKNCNIIFRKWGEGVKGRLEFPRKFIRFCSVTRPFSPYDFSPCLADLDREFEVLWEVEKKQKVRARRLN